MEKNKQQNNETLQVALNYNKEDLMIATLPLEVLFLSLTNQPVD